MWRQNLDLARCYVRVIGCHTEVRSRGSGLFVKLMMYAFDTSTLRGNVSRYCVGDGYAARDIVNEIECQNVPSTHVFL